MMNDQQKAAILRQFSELARSCIAPRPGSNFLPMLALYPDGDEGGRHQVDGDEMEALFRAGLMSAVPLPDGRQDVLGGGESVHGEIPDVELTHEWRISPLGKELMDRFPAPTR